jgi:hypothetical protein
MCWLVLLVLAAPVRAASVQVTVGAHVAWTFGAERHPLGWGLDLDTQVAFGRLRSVPIVGAFLQRSFGDASYRRWTVGGRGGIAWRACCERGANWDLAATSIEVGTVWRRDAPGSLDLGVFWRGPVVADAALRWVVDPRTSATRWTVLALGAGVPIVPVRTAE